MAFLTGNTVSLDNTGLFVPTKDTATLPSSPTQGQVIYNTDSHRMEIYDAGVWKDAADIRHGTFFTRMVITTGYVMGGYKSDSPWKNVNRMVHATDVMTNLGDLLTYAGTYTSGVNNLTKGFLWSTTDSMAAGTTTSAFNLATETNAGLNSRWNTWQAHDDIATIFKETQYAYIAGGTPDVDQFNLTTETMQGIITASYFGASAAGFGDAISTDTHGYAYGSALAVKLMFSTTTTSVISPMVLKTSTNPSSDGTVRLGGTYTSGSMLTHPQQKGISSKLQKGYIGNEGTYNGGYNLRRISFVTDTSLGTIAKPIGNSGEENFDMGQAHQYMMGMYDGAQNNRGWKFSYSTESGAELGAGSLRTGVAGGSSGQCVWKGS
jgi:hypothetical protein